MKNISVFEISRSDFLKASYSLWRLLFPFPVVDDITRPHMWSYFGVNFTKVFTKLDFACIHYSPFSCFFYVLKEKYEFICWKVRPISKLRSFSARQSMICTVFYMFMYLIYKQILSFRFYVKSKFKGCIHLLNTYKYCDNTWRVFW